MFPIHFRSLLWIQLPLLGYLAYLFYLSSQPQTGTEIPIPHIDKVIHFSLYVPLPLLFFRFLRDSSNVFIRYNFFSHGIILSLLYAASDEIHQYFVPTRSMDLFDFFADSAGIAAGAFFFWLYLGWKRRREES